MEERKSGRKLKVFVIIIIILAVGILGGLGIFFHFQETGSVSGNEKEKTASENKEGKTVSENEEADMVNEEEVEVPSSEEIYQYALEYLKNVNEDLADPESVEYSEYSSDIVDRFPTTEKLSNKDRAVPCDYAEDGENIIHRMYTVKMKMNYAGKSLDFNVYEYVSEGFSPLHHHELINDEVKEQIAAMKEAASYSMEQKYANLTSNDQDNIEDACKIYLYGDWYKTTNNDIRIKVDEYEIDGRGYGIAYSGPAMQRPDSGNICVDVTFYYLDDPETEHTLCVTYMRDIAVSYLFIDEVEYADQDENTIAEKEREFDEWYNANKADSGDYGYSATTQVCSQDAVCQQARIDAIEQIKTEDAINKYGTTVLDNFFGNDKDLSTFEAGNFIYSYNPYSSCHTVMFTIDEYNYSYTYQGSYTINAQYQDNGDGSISKISLIVQ